MFNSSDLNYGWLIKYTGTTFLSEHQKSLPVSHLSGLSKDLECLYSDEVVNIEAQLKYFP